MEIKWNDSEWTDGDLRAELERLKMSNEELSRALNEMSVTQNPANCQSNQFGFQVSELMTENWDLKQSIGRIRYGKPVRSIEDRDTINRLQTENQDVSLFSPLFEKKARK